ncbi:MAG: glycosyltransferase family 39 protein [Nitrospirae bacterium]|nr:glycosyltransferase family 39 protein [Nitrospirota bacterium]MBF0535515.1 glycosyltransferase family 39 protein [Nitrospirota bacterium]MBF0617353.1 glycosyltransferase family 39 protein [Nitrospirota bacterium]
MPFITSKPYLFFILYVIIILIIKIKKDIKNKIPVDTRTFIEILTIPLLTFILTDWLTNIVRVNVDRIRPCTALSGVHLLVGCTQSYSFPSGHASNSFSFAISLVYFMSGRFKKILLIYPIFMATLISVSRVYVGVHYPLDVIGGFFSALAIASLVIMLYRSAQTSYKKSPFETILYYSLLAISIFRIYYILDGPLDLSADEALYWDCSRHPELSYYSKGPFVMYVMYVFTHLFGVNVLAIRLPAVIFTALSSVFIFKLIRLIYGQDIENDSTKKIYEKNDFVALSSALIFQFIPLFATYGVVFTIDSPFVFFWIVSMYLLYKGAVKGKGGWVLLGMCVGLGLSAKYIMGFFYICSFLFLIFTGRKEMLKTLKPYISLLVSLIFFSPVIIWNYQHDWVTLKHTAGHAHLADGFTISPMKLLEFIGSQLGVVTPVIFVLMCIALIKLYRRNKDTESRFLFWFSAPVFIFFLIKSIQGKVQANWSMTAYVTALIAFCRYYLYKSEGLPWMMTFKHTRRFVKSAVIVAVIITAISHYPQILRLPADLDPASRLRGWKVLGHAVDKTLTELKRTGDEVLIFSDKYQVTSELAFYVSGNPNVYCAALGRRMSEYDMWPDINESTKRLRAHKPDVKINALYVTDTADAVNPIVSQAFDRCEQTVFNATERGQTLRTYSIFKCYNFKGINEMRPNSF